MEKKTLHQKLLQYYDISDEEFFSFVDDENGINISTSRFIVPFLNPNYVRVINKLKEFINQKKSFYIYGDYDVDGLTSTSIIYDTLKKCGVEKVGFHIPSRDIDGYGINTNYVTLIAEHNYDVIICVDNGITKVNEINLAKTLGMEVVIIDHHLKEDDIELNTDLIFHQFESEFTDYNISAAFLSLFISYGLLGHYEDYYVVLASLAVFSDAMPLVSMNLILAKLGLKLLNRYKFPQIIKLISNYDNERKITYTDINFEINSKLNGVTRLIDVPQESSLVKYLLSTDEKYQNILSKNIYQINEKKKTVVKNLLDTQLNSDDSKTDVIIEKFDMKVGLSGLVAGRLLNDYKLVIVFAKRKDSSLLTGSLRTVYEINALEILEQCKEYLSNYGGHDKACGLGLEEENFEPFKEKFLAILDGTDKVVNNEKALKYIDLNLDDVDYDCYEEVESFGPFGNGNEYPLLRIKVDLNLLKNYSESTHLIYRMKDDASLVFFNSKETIKTLISENKDCYFYGKLQLNHFNRKLTTQFLVEKVEN